MVVELTDGFEVVGEAVDGEEGVAMAASLKPDLVLMDVQMPRMNGIEATKHILQLPDAPRVLVMSTHESGDFGGPAIEAGAMAFIPKAQFGMDALTAAWAEAEAGDADAGEPAP